MHTIVQTANSSLDIASTLGRYCPPLDKFREHHASAFLARAKSLGTLPKITLSHISTLMFIYSHNNWNLPLISPDQLSCFPSMAAIAKMLRCSENWAREKVGDLEAAGILIREERLDHLGRHDSNRYKLSTVLYWEACIDSIVRSKLSPPIRREILAYLREKRKEALAEAKGLREEKTNSAKVLGLKGAALSMIATIEGQLASGKTHDRKGRLLEERLAHWQQVLAAQLNTIAALAESEDFWSEEAGDEAAAEERAGNEPVATEKTTALIEIAVTEETGAVIKSTSQEAAGSETLTTEEAARKEPFQASSYPQVELGADPSGPWASLLWN